MLGRSTAILTHGTSLATRDLLHPTLAALVSVIVNYGGTFILVFEAARAAGLTPAQTASWVWSVSIGVGLTGAFLSYLYRAPIITAWSTPGAAFLVVALPSVPYPEAIGAFVLSGVAFLALGLSGTFDRAVGMIPRPIAAGLLAGVLAKFGVSAFASAAVDPLLVCILVFAYAALRRFTARYAIVGVLCIGLALVIARQQAEFGTLGLTLAAPNWTAPAFSWNALLSVALPLFVVTLTGQYMPGMLVLRRDGYLTSANPIVTVTGLGSALMAPFGSHAFNVAAITAAICTGPEAHEDARKRYIAGVACGVLYTLIGLFGATLATLFVLLPPQLIATLAGLALLGAIGGNLVDALSGERDREAALITFLATTANLSLFGIGGAFWGLVAGLAVHAILRWRPLQAIPPIFQSRPARSVQQTSDS